MLENSDYKHLFLIDFFFIISFIAINLGINEIPILFTLFIIFQYFSPQNKNVKITTNTFILFVSVLISGILLSIFYRNYLNISSSYHHDINLRIRFYIIRITYALAVSLYIYKLDKFKLLYLIYLISLLNLATGLCEIIIQLVLFKFDRLSMLSREPSSMAMFYVFAVPLLLQYLKYDKSARNKVWSFIIIGLLILSKAQIIILFLWVLVYIYNIKRKLALIPVVLILVLTILPYLREIHQIDVILRVLSISFAEGLSGLNENNQIYTSITFRLSGSLTAIYLFGKHIFGIGFGMFHPLFIDYMNTSQLGSSLSGREISEVLFENGYATPKSAILELLTSCGLFFLIPFSFISIRFIKDQLPFLIKISFVSLTIISFMVELAPFLTFISILLSLQSKFRVNENINL